MSHRTQVILEDWQYEKILERMRRDGKSMGELVREAVTEYVSPSRAGGPQGTERDPIFDLIGIGSSDGTISSEDHDVVLYGFARKAEPPKEEPPKEEHGQDLRRLERVDRPRRRRRP